jgi:hypothetical protein
MFLSSLSEIRFWNSVEISISQLFLVPFLILLQNFQEHLHSVTDTVSCIFYTERDVISCSCRYRRGKHGAGSITCRTAHYNCFEIQEGSYTNMFLYVECHRSALYLQSVV